jgi:hypothetical protein
VFFAKSLMWTKKNMRRKRTAKRRRAVGGVSESDNNR